MTKVNKTDEEWRQELSDEEYRVTRQKGTEMPFSGEYDQCFEDGVYRCICCGAELFSSEDKFQASCGWPSFSKPVHGKQLEESPDHSIPGRLRTEVTCHQCGAHLGHVFDDGPEELTGQRYCINSVALKLDGKKS